MKRLIKILMLISFVGAGRLWAISEGAGSSGGGDEGVIIEEAGEVAVFEKLPETRLELLLFFNRDSHKVQPDFPISIIDIIKTTTITPERDGPCYDQDGQEKDGSVDIENKNICISTFRLGNKLTLETIRPRLLALLSHEYSHFTGTGEDEAIAIQKLVLKKLARGSTEKAKELIDYAIQMQKQFISLSDLTVEDARQWNWDNSNVCSPELSYRLVYRYKQFHQTLSDNSLYAFYSKDELDKDQIFLMKVIALEWGVCYFRTINNHTPLNGNGYQKTYKQGFNRQNSVSVNDFFLNNNDPSLITNKYGSNIIRNTKSSRKLLREETLEINNYFREQLSKFIKL